MFKDLLDAIDADILIEGVSEGIRFLYLPESGEIWLGLDNDFDRWSNSRLIILYPHHFQDSFLDFEKNLLTISEVLA